MTILSGVHTATKELTITTYSLNSVCCNSKYIFLMQWNPPMMCVYDWSTNHICDIEPSKLGVEASDYSHAVGSIDESTIMLAVGDCQHVNSINTFKII